MAKIYNYEASLPGTDRAYYRTRPHSNIRSIIVTHFMENERRVKRRDRLLKKHKATGCWLSFGTVEQITIEGDLSTPIPVGWRLAGTKGRKHIRLAFALKTREGREFHREFSEAHELDAQDFNHEINSKSLIKKNIGFGPALQISHCTYEVLKAGRDRIIDMTPVLLTIPFSENRSPIVPDSIPTEDLERLRMRTYWSLIEDIYNPMCEALTRRYRTMRKMGNARNADDEAS
jgi:hypothetical protein